MSFPPGPGTLWPIAMAMRAAGEHQARRLTQTQRDARGHRVRVGRPADPVGAEQTSVFFHIHSEASSVPSNPPVTEKEGIRDYRLIARQTRNA